MSELVTGDAVRLEVRIAGLPSRSLALTVDLTVQVMLLATLMTVALSVFPADGGAAAALTLVVTVAVLVGWPTMIETLTGGQSLGKAMLGLRVVRDDGGPVRMRHSLVRALAMVFLDLWVTFGVVGGLSVLVSKRSKRMGDHLAGTIVTGERLPRAVAAGMRPVVMPMALADWAARLDLIAVPDQLALSIRTFLHRAPTMEPSAREMTAVRLASQLSTHVRMPAPWGTPAEAYLAAVLAERSRRASAASDGWSGTGPTAPGAPPGAAPGWPPVGQPAWNAQPGPEPSGPAPWGPGHPGAPSGWQSVGSAPAGPPLGGPTSGWPPSASTSGWPPAGQPTWNGPAAPAPAGSPQAGPASGWAPGRPEAGSPPLFSDPTSLRQNSRIDAGPADSANLDTRPVDPGPGTGVSRPPAPPAPTPPPPPPPGFSAPL